MPRKGWFYLSVLAALGCFYGLNFIVTHYRPVYGDPLAFPNLLFLLTAGGGLFFLSPPVSAWLNARFADPDWPQRDGQRIVRQSAWVAMLGVLLLYLQMVRALNLSVALSLTIGFILLEIYFLLRA